MSLLNANSFIFMDADKQKISEILDLVEKQNAIPDQNPTKKQEIQNPS